MAGGQPSAYPKTDHKGIPYKNFNQMCKAYGKTSSMVRARLKNGWSLEEALTFSKYDKIYSCKDHLGQEYSSQQEMCEHYGIAYRTFRHRIINGISLKDALAIPTGNIRDGKISKPIKDHKGKIYDSKRQMCQTYGISVHTYDNRIKLGWSVKQALTNPSHVSKDAKPVYDHKGNKYLSVADMCAEYDINPTTFQQRIQKGILLEQALTSPPKRQKPKQITYKGVTYSSPTALAHEINIPSMTLINGLRKGWSAEEVIDFVSKGIRIVDKIQDHKGQCFASKEEMCKAYGITIGRFKRNLKKGYSIEKALTYKGVQYESILEKTIPQKCGLRCTAIEYVDSDHVKVEWEDNIISVVNKAQFSYGNATHPQLCHRKNISFCGFNVTFIPGVSSKEYLYECSCVTCGHTYIMTPQQMITHETKHIIKYINQKGNNYDSKAVKSYTQ